MMIRSKRTVQTLTGSIEPITFKELISRAKVIKFRAKTPNHAKTISTRKQTQSAFNKTEYNFPQICESQTDKLMTKFSPYDRQKSWMNEEVQQKKPKRVRIYSGIRYSIEASDKQISNEIPFKRKVKEVQREQNNLKSIQKSQQHEVVYKRQINEFKQLYQSLGNILASIKQHFVDVQNSIAQYLSYIQTKKTSFIDDFIQGKQKKLQKVVRESRLQESLSIAYLFLEIAQNRIQNHESYLTNFLGYCLSNVLLTARIYMIKQRKEDYKLEDFEIAIQQVEIGSFGHEMISLQEVMLMMQHNNEIIVMMQKKLGRFNTKFQSCIKLFFKEAQRKKTSCVQCTHYIFQYLALHIHEAELFGISKCLQIAPTPYCAPPTKQYTLVIEPLSIIYSSGKYRPYLFQFLQWAVKYFQIILWTWELPYEPEVEAITKRLQGFLTAKLYRYHCLNIDYVWVKDLQRLGRPTEKIIIIDYDKRIYSKQHKNGIEMRWTSKTINRDKGLLFLCQILQQMVTTGSSVEDTIRIYAQELYSISGL